MSTPNLDATGLWWVSALTWFDFKLEYQKGHDNTVADILSWVTTRLDLETVKSILSVVALGMVNWANMTQPWWKATNIWNKKYESWQASHWWKCMLPTGLKPREKTQHWVQCWTGWRHRSRQIWRCFWQNTPPVKKIKWSYGIDRIFWFIRRPYTCAQQPKVKLKISCSLWSPRHTVLPPWMGATEVQVIKGTTIPCPCCGNVSGGWEWLTKYRNPWSLAYIVCSIRANCLWHPYTQLCPLLQWISYM